MAEAKLIMGDCLEVLPTLADGSVDAVVTDPPYGMSWDTDCSRFSVGAKRHRKSAAGHDWGKPIEGDSLPFDPSPWLNFPRVILWGCNHFAKWLPVGTTLVWVKRNESAFGSFLSDAEIGWQKGGHGVYLHKDLSMNSLAKKRSHPNQKPIGLLKWCILRLGLATGATILDPYMGSGSTGVAAIQLGFDFIGIEKDEGYFATAERRLAAARAEAADLFATA